LAEDSGGNGDIRHPKVHQAQVTILFDQNIVWFYVAMIAANLIESFDSHDLGVSLVGTAATSSECLRFHLRREEVKDIPDHDFG
jgi:hypothetical protein